MRVFSLETDIADPLGLTNHEGYLGCFTRAVYPGALPNGTCIFKANSETGDQTKDGTGGTVMGSIGHPEVGIMYFIEWDNNPRMVVGCIAKKIEKLTESP